MSLSQLRSEVNAIKRKLVRELRVVRARRAVEDYCGLWASLVARKKLPPDPFRLLLKPASSTPSNPGDFAARRRLPQSSAMTAATCPTPMQSSSASCPGKPAWASYPT